MKYPQLVSTRAVNAISDWLVSRLEQLGVEAPQIYTRLLLSLLQSSVHINDPIEFSSLETFIVNRKGGGNIRRYLQFDANTLKKLNAIQCLSEIVSPEQELTSIESLVDELWEKLKDIEKQTDRNIGINDTILIDEPINKSKAGAADIRLQKATGCSPKRAAIFCKSLSHNEKASKVVLTDDLDVAKCETETDPKKRYFNAFPALSKEMEDSFRIWRRNAKSLTWPANRCSSSATISVNQASSSIMTSTFGSVVTASEGKNAEMLKSDEILDATNLTVAPNLNTFHNHAIVTSTSGLKRKTKRRKSQSMSKGRTLPNMRKSGSSYNEGLALVSAHQAGRKPNRHLSPTQWDTDFDGYWEMGRDLIKEFFAKQGDRGRNRCNSEGSVHQQQQQRQQANESQQKLQSFEFNELAMNCNKTAAASDMQESTEAADACHSPRQMMPKVDISFCYDETAEDDDTYKSISELTADSSLNTSRSSPRRLYQRLVIPEDVYNDDINQDNTRDDHNDFMQFEAKFNSKIAALWHDGDADEEAIANGGENKPTATTATAALWAAPSELPLPTVEPIKENLKNFWSIFNNHPMDFSKILQQQQQQHEQERNETLTSQQQQFTGGEHNNSSFVSLPFDVLVTTVQDDNANFISMPQLERFVDPITNNDVVNNKRRHDGRSTPVGVFLQNSIWSDSLNGGKNTDTDESFYLKVWNSNKKLYNLDAIYEAKLTEMSDDSKINSSSSSASFQYYGSSKWSEGINAGPTNLQQQQLQQQRLKIADKEKRSDNVAHTEQFASSIDCVDASMPTTASSSSCSYMLSSSGIFSGHTPSMQSSQQSWHGDKKANNDQKSLTDMYGLSSPAHNNDSSLHKEQQIDQVALISLPNHSNECSGFSDYASLKSLAKALGQDNIKQQQLNYQAQLPVVKELPRYADDENLLTSERTHFQPIKAYADGYTFDVCSALDVINYRRSESGYLYYESHKYLEYTRNDSYMAEDVDANAAVSAAPLYAGSNCEAAVARKQQKERKGDELILKFRIMNREMACQTDDEDIVLRRNLYAAQMHPLYLIFSGASNGDVQIPTTGQACSDAIEALNRAVAAAATAQAAAERERIQLDRPWAGLHEIVGSSRNMNCGGGGSANQSHIWTRAQAPPHEEIIGGDEIDFCNESSCVVFGDSVLEQQWSVQSCQMAIGTDICCLNAAGGGISHNNDTQAGAIAAANTSVATLWGCCAACEYKEAPPANNLLRDELNSEADQIMSDLKNMQDLYIGAECSRGSNEEPEQELDWHVNEVDGIAHPMAIIAAAAVGDKINNALARQTDSSLELRQRETQQKVLQQVNKLIANLMRPERGNDTNVLAHAAASAHRELGESLWPDDGEHSIWKNEVSGEVGDVLAGNNGHEKPQNAEVRSSVLRAEEKQFLSQLTWEHDNLAELWAKQTPPLTSPQQLHQQQEEGQQPQHSQPLQTMCSSNKSKAAIDNVGQQRDNDNQAKEISKCATVAAPDINSSSVVKRIQQFLNSTAAGNNTVTSAKLKLANRKRRHSASQNYAIVHGAAAAAGICNQKSNTFGAVSNNNNNNHNQNINNNNNSNNNNNNFKTSNLNNINIERDLQLTLPTHVGDHVGADSTTFELLNTSNTTNTVFSDDVDMEHSLYDPSAFLIINNNNNNISNGDGIDVGIILPSPKQTIITCKYWAAIDPLMDSTEDSIDCAVDDIGEGAATATATFSCLVDKNDSLLMKHVTMLTRPLTR